VTPDPNFTTTPQTAYDIFQIFAGIYKTFDTLLTATSLTKTDMTGIRNTITAATGVGISAIRRASVF